jgi:hypothetical protein
MSISIYHSQINTLEKEIQRLDDKIYTEQKKLLDRDAKINSVMRTINKNTSVSLMKSKNDQVMRYRKEMLGFSTSINNYEKQKRSKKEALLKKKEALRKAELVEQKKGQLALNRNSAAGRSFNNDIGSTTFETEEEFMEETDDVVSSEPGAIQVFVSYSWDTKEHEEKVFDFVNHLRTPGGFDAHMDKGLSQQETAINFVKMMYKAMHHFPKIVVILSEGYKKKADGFTGGVGTEYELMINDINDHPNKYVLASFSGRDSRIVPAGFKGRDIIDLSDADEMTRLYEKLRDHQRFVFAEVASAKPELPITLARPFVVVAKEEAVPVEPISIAPLIKATGDAGLSARKYTDISFSLKFEFVNTTAVTIDGFSYAIKLPRELDLEHYHEADSEGFVNYQQSYDGRMFRGQRVQTQDFLLKVAHQNVWKIMESAVKVEVFTEHGPIEREFPAKELIKIKPGGEHHVEAVPISPYLFI